ncbi:hypothetical protein EV207_12531 [Scopulibacillus darangshiensis]|uniref:Uncharacterized protein n=1 Tax=Scopulibacillus darangshiensis TaxID=442528 RepID=A0A4R2NSF0_9BACL|nr:hypothetical protein EV207_12531 [Scopulibacillus darangshiensis]
MYLLRQGQYQKMNGSELNKNNLDKAQTYNDQ